MSTPITDKLESDVISKFTAREVKLEELRNIARPRVNILYYVGVGLFLISCAFFMLWLGWTSKNAEEGVKQITNGSILGLSGMLCVAIGIYNQVNDRIKKLTNLLIKEIESQSL